jgi:hypothetical protein
MRKIPSAIALVLVLVAALPACGEASRSDAEQDAAGATGGAASDAAAPSPDAPAVLNAPDAVTAPAGCLGAVVRVGDMEIFAYEASRADATGEAAGADSTAACSRAGVLPWADATLPEARAACAASGFALCAGADWLAACGGDAHRLFPYGAAHRAGACNDHVGGSSALEPTGARADCHTPEGVFDLSGNLAEMTEDAMKRGGSFRVNAVMYQSEYAQCDAQLRVFEGVHSDEVGFRCCRRP